MPNSPAPNSSMLSGSNTDTAADANFVIELLNPTLFNAPGVSLGPSEMMMRWLNEYGLPSMMSSSCAWPWQV